jgi:glutamate--cysteine ligase
MFHASSERVQTIHDLVEYYHRVNWDQSLYVGIEWERSGVHKDSMKPVVYDEKNGYNAILQKLVDEAGWEAIERDGDNIYEIQRGETRVAIEGDGRLELAGSPQESLHNLARELRLHNHEVIEMGNFFGVGWLSLGQQPLHSNEQIAMLKKDRYHFLQGIGDKDMMETMTKRLNGVTANLSYLNEENAIQKTQAAFRVLPIISAIFACSPFDAGKRSAFLDSRRHCIQNHAPDRTGIPGDILSGEFTIADWFQYYLSLRVVLVSEDEQNHSLPEGDFTFADWMQSGYKGTYPTYEDFDQHVKTTWSDIRLRPSYLEYRVPDSVPFRYIMAVPALMKGILFDSDSWEQVRKLTEKWTYDDVLSIDRRAWVTGLQTEVHGKTLLTYAQELITIANEKLHSFERTDASQDDESIYLSTIKEQIFIKEKSPAEELAELYDNEWNADLSRILEWCDIDAIS